MTDSEMMALVETALKWVSEHKGRCGVEVKIGDLISNDTRKVWVFDYNFMHGKHVNKPSDFNTFYDSYITEKEREIKEIAKRVAQFKEVSQNANAAVDGSV